MCQPLGGSGTDGPWTHFVCAVNINSAYDSANQGIGSLAKTQLAPAVQSTLNGLAGRGMLNSSVAADALKGTMSNINTQLLNSATNLNASRAGSLADFGKQLLAGGAMGQYSETTNQLAPYELMANLIQGLQ